MSVYFVTGKLGSGKSLVAVSKIKERLIAGRPVATNMNIFLAPMIGKDKKNTRLYRLPDKPTVYDLNMIPKVFSNPSQYDENVTGLIVLDECGTWFNSRTWNDKDRTALVDWFLHVRKIGWDVIFIIQDVSMADKQARSSLAEHVVYCSRTDRVNIPIIGSIFNLITSTRIPLPKIHIGVVRYGENPTAMRVDIWKTIGQFYYRCYETTQVYLERYPHGTYCVLPPYYLYNRTKTKWGFNNIMRISKIYFRKWSKIFLIFLGFFISSSYFAFTTDYFSTVKKVKITNEKKVTLSDRFDGYKIISYSNFPNQLSYYRYFNPVSHSYLTSDSLRNQGLLIKSRGSCESLIVKGDDYVSVYCE